MSQPLVMSLEQVFNNAKDLMVTLLLDGSGSMSSEWETQRTIAINLATKLKGSQLQVIQFSTIAKIECPFTNNFDMVINSLKNMKITGGGTNMSDAFKTTKNSYFRTMNTESTPVVIFITDGQYSGENPLKEIQSFLAINPKPRVVGVGVGSGTSSDVLQQILPGQPVFHINHFAALNQMIDSLVITPAVQPEPPVRLFFSPANQDIQKSRSNLTIQFNLEPNGKIDVVPAGTEIKFLHNEFFYSQSIKTTAPAKLGEPFRSIITLVIQPNAISYGEFPEKLWYEITLNGTKLKGSVQMNLGWLAGDFIFDKDPNRPINWLVWGPMGSGKSSLINSIVSMLRSKQEVHKPITAYRSIEHVTKAYSCNSLVDHVDQDDELGQIVYKKLNVNIWDPWGLTETNYQKQTVSHFLSGQVEPGTAMDVQAKFTVPDASRCIHAVILMIPIGIGQSTNMLKTLSNNIKEILDYGIRPVIMINFLSTVLDQNDIKQSYDKIYEASRLSHSDIFMVDNYDDEVYRNMEKELKIWKLLKKVFNESSKNIERIIREESKSNKSTGQVDVSSSFGKAEQKQQQQLTSPNRNRDQAYNNNHIANGNGNGSSNGKLKCKTTSCSNFDQLVTSPFCQYCGSKAIMDAPLPKVCGSMGCVNVNKPLTTPRCGECGNLAVNQLPTVKMCLTINCSKYQTVSDGQFPRCAYCGQLYSDFHSYESSEKPKVKCCVNTVCTNYSKELTTKFCAYCGCEGLEN